MKVMYLVHARLRTSTSAKQLPSFSSFPRPNLFDSAVPVPAVPIGSIEGTFDFGPVYFGEPLEPSRFNATTPAMEQISGTAVNEISENGGDYHTVERDLQTLHERVQLLEQRVDQPVGRERTLEMVVAFLWLAHVRLGTLAAQRNSNEFHLVSMHAPGVLEAAPRASTVCPPLNNSRPCDPPISADYFTSEDLTEFMNIDAVGASKNPRSDSGYQTGR